MAKGLDYGESILIAERNESSTILTTCTLSQAVTNNAILTKSHLTRVASQIDIKVPEDWDRLWLLPDCWALFIVCWTSR